MEEEKEEAQNVLDHGTKSGNTQKLTYFTLKTPQNIMEPFSEWINANKYLIT